MAGKRYRVAQWATGHTGISSLRSIIEHPQYDLVGLRVYADDKVGRDAGELCGLASTGVVATRDIEEILAARPDCVMYMPLLHQESIDDMCRILESGSNIVTTVVGFPHAGTLDPGVRERVEAACSRGGTSLYGTGSCPGFITEVVPLALLVMERRFDNIAIAQYADLSTRRSPEFLREIFGIDPATADLADGAARSERTDGAALRQIADAMSVPIDDITATSEIAVATKDTEIGVMTVPAGTVGAWRQDITGYHRGSPLFSYSRVKYVVRDLEPAWEVLNTGWHVSVRGDVPMEMDLRFASDGYGTWSPGINANLPVNSVADVCDARPGILTTAELPLVPNFSR
ncbi:NAD(P)H-dependent amine dehydrogenase family protein [Streptomyces fuscichromogenes]|uniref:Dihydrodipicolinate reductase n=1 Tax=Streptomyces fuscichromogenes TaxID=1324013 RepID=A0A917X9R1_9ACTN|nr:dihydrodipicolinate reductase [Streptomyces fuscichromogenes]GGM98218.1 dihydrodipicolinate reductase [Streptomyces fuscichromogenes]